MKKILTFLMVSVMFCSFSFAQKTITGNVSDTDGLALIGANITVKGTTTGVITDIDGNYSIDVPGDDAVLVFSYTGYKSQEIAVGNQNQIDIVLSEGAILDEVVVVGYSTTTKMKSNVSSVGLRSDKVESRPNASVVQTLQGQVPGLNITTTNGQPGADSNINLRGVTSINGNTEPLFIIDGTPVDEDNFRSLNPNEIENITVLKDAGATAIYGNRGANGVILIETKQGSYGQALEVTYSGLYGSSSLQGNDYDLYNSQDQLRLEQRFGRGLGSTLSDAEINSESTTDWADFFFRDAFFQNHTLSISSGGENTSQFTSFGYSDTEGILKSSSLQRYNIRNNFNVKSANDKFNLSTNVSVNWSTNDEPNAIGGTGINRNLVIGAYQSVPYLSPDDYVDGRSLLSPLTFTNTPLFLMDRLETYTRKEDELKMIGSINASYEILDGLTFRSNLGSDYTNQRITRAEGPESFNALLFAQSGNTTPGFQQQIGTQVFSLNWLNSINYSFEVGDHSISASAFTEYFRAFYDEFSYFAEGLDPRTFSPGDGSGFIDDNTANDFFVDQAGANQLRAGLFSYFGLVDYDYQSKYGLSATLRRDASYRFSESNRWGTFWSVSGRWNISEEAFMDDSPFDILKLRASIGTTGNQRIVDLGGLDSYFGAPDLTRDLFATGGGYGGQNSIFLSQLANTTLKWEEVSSYNLGLDFELFDYRLRGAVDYYVRTTEDLFQNRPVSAVNSVTALRANTGSLRNSGFDLALGYDIIRGSDPRDLKVTLNFVGNYNKQEVIDLPTPDGRIQNGNLLTQEGGVLREYYVIPYQGVNPANGNLLFLDAEGNLTENPSPGSDRVATGKNIYPDYQGSFGLEIDYKGFYVETQFNYVVGVYRFDFDYAGFVDPNAIGQFRHSADLDRAWTEENRVTDIPSLNASNLAIGGTDRFLKKSDYLRLRFFRVGYNLSSDMLGKLGLSRANIFLNGENFITWSEWRGFDAETDLGDANANRYPTPRTLSAGIEIGF